MEIFPYLTQIFRRAGAEGLWPVFGLDLVLLGLMALLLLFGPWSRPSRFSRLNQAFLLFFLLVSATLFAFGCLVVAYQDHAGLISSLTDAKNSADIYQGNIRDLQTTVGELQDEHNYATPYTFNTLAGSPGQKGSTDGVGGTARFDNPASLAVDADGNIYVGDRGNHSIRKITPDGVVTTLAKATDTVWEVGGAGGTTRPKSPVALAVDGAGNLYVMNFDRADITKIPPTGPATILVGSAYLPSNGLTVNQHGMVYVAKIKSLPPSPTIEILSITPGGLVKALAGGQARERDGTGSAAGFDGTGAMAVDMAGNVYMTEDAGTIRKITSDGAVTTLAGSYHEFGSMDGRGRRARFSRFEAPNGLAVDAAGNLFVADSNTIRKVSPAGEVTTLAGTARSRGCVDGTGNAVLFNNPNGVAVDAAGNIYVADTGNNIIRKGWLAAPAPGPQD